MIDPEAEARRDNDLRDRAAALPGEQRQAFYREFGRRVKDPDTYAVLNYLFIAGLHHFYLRRWWRGAMNLAVFCIAIMALVRGDFLVGLLLLLAITLVELPALFLSQRIVARYNNDLAEHLLKTLGD
jgi:hypothetical protein